MKVLVTGAGGSIGRTLVHGLPALGHELRGLDLIADSSGDCALGWIVGDCLDPEVVEAAVAGVDAVVHLAGHPDENSLPASLESHVHTTGRLLDAMVMHGVQRMVYASSNHAVGLTARSELLTTAVRPRPDTFYGVAKVAAEALLSLYADRHGIRTTALRIGTFEEQPSTVRALSTWLSPADAVRMIDAAICSPPPGFDLYYGVSANTRGWWDLDPGRQSGFAPLDDAETFADFVESRSQDDAEAAYVGGPLATDASSRPAF